jgi:hypothetical protein
MEICERLRNRRRRVYKQRLPQTTSPGSEKNQNFLRLYAPKQLVMDEHRAVKCFAAIRITFSRSESKNVSGHHNLKSEAFALLGLGYSRATNLVWIAH